MLESLTHKTMTLATTLQTGLAEAGFWQKLWFRDAAATASGQDTDYVAMALWWICVGWFVFLMGLMVYFGLKYRRQAAGPAPRSSEHNTPLEIAWTIIPTLFLIWMFFAGYRGYIKKFVAPGDSIDINMIAGKWYWAVTYPNGGETPETTMIGAKEIPVFYFPANTPVRFRIDSKDVMHALYVPDFRIKVDAMPNRYTYAWFEAAGPVEGHPQTKKFAADDPAEWKRGKLYTDHWLFCAEYCGDEHSEMWAIIRIVPSEVYKAWLEAIMSGDGKPPAEIGQRIYKTKCASCHSIDGSKNTGPTWKDLYNNPALPMEGGSTVKGDDNYIRESIRNPAAKIHAGYPNQMTPWPADVLPDKQVDYLIEYMKTISTHAPKGDAAATAPPAETKK